VALLCPLSSGWFLASRRVFCQAPLGLRFFQEQALGMMDGPVLLFSPLLVFSVWSPVAPIAGDVPVPVEK